jgi:hypothetical protein
MNGPSVNSGVPLEASTLNTGASVSKPPVKMKMPASFISAISGRSCRGSLVRPPLTYPTNGSRPIRQAAGEVDTRGGDRTRSALASSAF